MSFEDLRRRAAVVREVALEVVLIHRGAVRDRCDKSKWHTEQGPLSVTGPKFMNWERGEGGGGAIDLVMHLADVDFRTAVAWLEQQLGVCHLAVGQATTRYHCSRKKPTVPEGYHTLRLPVRDDRMLVLEHGRPMVFGKERNKGIRLHGHQPEVVTIGENGITEDDILVHDETDPLIAFMLAHIYWPEFPVPVGIIRRISRPTHDELLSNQIEQAIAGRGKGDLAKLLASGETWTVEGDGS